MATHGGALAKDAGQASMVQSLTQLATPGPQLVIKPEDSVVQSGKEIRLSVVYGRISASGEHAFKLDYDPEILQFKRLDNAELIDTGETPTVDHVGQAGAITFHFARQAQRSPRTMHVIFMAKAPGVSPIRVGLTDAGSAAEVLPEVVVTGVVRVR
jgi:general secretion pathway protein D